MSTRKYKSQIGTIPKIVNNFLPKTDNQKLFYNKVSDFNNQLILCHGIAGTGKTYVSIYKALQDVLRRGLPYDKLIIINPTVDVGNEDKLGYLPGELQQKIQQYNESTFTILNKIIGKSKNISIPHSLSSSKVLSLNSISIELVYLCLGIIDYYLISNDDYLKNQDCVLIAKEAGILINKFDDFFVLANEKNMNNI